MTRDAARIDGYLKVTGKAVYTDDLKLDRMLYACEVHCPHPHAKLLSVDKSAAQAMPGVVCVLTAADLDACGIANGEMSGKKEKPLLAKGEVLCAQEAVTLVVAESYRQARDAAARVQVAYEALPAVLTAREAAKPGAVKVYPEGNEACACILEKGDAPSALASAPVVVSESFSTQRMHHGAIEPDCVVTEPEGDGLFIHCGSKGPYNVRKEVSHYLALPEERIRVQHKAIGGGFGGKMVDTVILAARAGAVTLYTGRPCKLLWSREECMSEGSKRHSFDMTCRLAAKPDGTLLAMEMTGLVDAGAYLSHTKGVTFRAMAEAAGPYAIPNIHVDLRAVFTHTVSNDAVRGFGSPQVAFAMESTMDILAKRLGMPPEELRRKNFLRDGDTMASGQVAERVGISACMEKLAEVYDMARPLSWQEGRKAYGRGYCAMMRGESHGALSNGNDVCGADLDLLPDGQLVLSTSISEVGQAAYTAQAQFLSNLLGIPMEQVRVRGADTEVTPRCTTTSGSRGTISGINAVWLAYLDLLEKMKLFAARALGVQEAQLHFCNNNFYAENGRQRMSFCQVQQLCCQGGQLLHAEGRWRGPYTGWDWEKHTGAPYYSYSYGVSAADVEVDLVTGRVFLRDLVTVNDLGRIIHFEEATAQIAGGMMMAAGFALTEQADASQGSVRECNFDRYLMQLAPDLTQIRPYAVELVPAPNPMGVHGVGEMSASTSAPAIANAVANALGRRITELPLTLERVRAAIDLRKDGGLR